MYFDLRWRFFNYYNLQLEGPWVYWSDIFIGVNKVLGVKVENKLTDNIPSSRLAKLYVDNSSSFSTIRDTIKELFQFGSRHIGTLSKITGSTTFVTFSQWEYYNRVEALKEGRAYSAKLDPIHYHQKMKDAFKEMEDVSMQANVLRSNKSFTSTPQGRAELEHLSDYESMCRKSYRLYAAKYIETALTQGAAIQSVSDAEENFWSFKFVPGQVLVKVKFDNPLIKAQNVLHEVQTSLNEDDIQSLQSFLDHSTSDIMELGGEMSRGMSLPRIMG